MVLAKLKDTTVEIKDIDDLLRVVKEARGQEEPLVIQDNGAEIVVPASRHPSRRRRTLEERANADEEAFLSAAGSWKGLIDPEELKKQIYDARGQRPRYVDRLLDEE
ncbi:MAG: hypothetical protein QOJ59_4855 [Thermomicrobiales bacterium]|jgi:hypothetical protein|nr:hypothetical protein [Thermomicrobiales bacterium]